MQGMLLCSRLRHSPSVIKTVLYSFQASHSANQLFNPMGDIRSRTSVVHLGLQEAIASQTPQ